ncbi:MAG: TetR family transcriptional regulator [Pseudomonadota bacterium]
MTKTASTRERLLAAARDLFWTRGYSNVSVRDITNAAGVDAALVSRYFGGKQGLFEATLAGIPRWEALDAEGEALLAAAVASFAHPFDPDCVQANPFTMLLSNIIDPEMGDKIRTLVQEGLAAPLARKLDGPYVEERAAMLLAALFGMALMRKNFQIAALTDPPPQEVSAQIRHLAQAALHFKA